MTIASPSVSADLARSAMMNFQQGNQQEAVDLIRPQADSGQPWALALYTYLQAQRGEPYITEALPYLRQGLALGMPWLLNHVLGFLLSSEQTQQHLVELSEIAVKGGGGAYDPISQAISQILGGNARLGVELMNLTTLPSTVAPDWGNLINEARTAVEQLHTELQEVGAQRDDIVRIMSSAGERVQQQADATAQSIESTLGTVEARSSHLIQLIEKVTNAAVSAQFNEDATENDAQAKNQWRWGVRIVSIAALLAILPLMLHYIGRGPELSSTAAVTAHIAPALALGALAGLFLSRARERDRARRRAKDLVITLNTVYVYAEQIADPQEKSQFLQEMGRIVMQTFLAPETSKSSDSLAGLAQLVQAIRS